MKVTEKLTEPPRILLTRSLMLPLALVSTNRVSRRNHHKYDRLVLMV